MQHKYAWYFPSVMEYGVHFDPWSHQATVKHKIGAYYVDAHMPLVY